MSNETGPFDRILDSATARDRTARMILIAMGALGVLLLVLVLPPISLLSGDDDAGTTSGAGVSLPKVPDGYEALSTLLRPGSMETQGPVELTVSLAQPVSEGANLGLYTYRDGKWERLAAATLVNNGAAAKGQVNAVPSNVAVLRRVASAVEVSGWIVAGGQIDPAAMDVLSVINPIDYTPSADGSVQGTASVVNGGGKAVIPTVRALSPAEIEAVNTILASPALREAHVAALVQLASQPNLAGIDIDYPAVALARKPDFTSFISVLADRLHASGRQLTITLPTPIKTGVTWDTGAFDWKEIAAKVDKIKLVPEPDPSQYYRKMEEVLAFLRPNVDLKKVSLLVTRASREKGANGLAYLTLNQALSVASSMRVLTNTPIAPNSSVQIVGMNIYQDDGASGIRWDESSFAVSFSYPGQGGQRTVWFENSLSLAFKLDFAKRQGLGGVHIDDLRLDPQQTAFWAPLSAFVESGEVSLSQPNGVLLRPVWQSSAGAMEPGDNGEVIWRAPAQAGVYDVSLIVSDGVIRATQKLTLEVRGNNATPTASPTRTP